MMSKLCVDYISPFVGRLDDIDGQGIDTLVDIRQMLDEYNFSTKLLAASMRDVFHIHEAISVGADAITLPVDVLEKIVSHPLTDLGMETFLADWQKLGISQFP